jgi:ABC-2 type transport system permease protein
MAPDETHAARGLRPVIVRRQTFITQRMRALLRKEFRQILRDPRVLMALVLPLVFHLMLFGSLLSPAVTNLRLGVVDDSQSAESRELVAVLSESKSFRVAGVYPSVDRLGDAIARGDLDAGLVMSSDFARNIERGQPSTVQVLLNAMNANTASISQGYMRGVIENYTRGLAGRGVHAAVRPSTRTGPAAPAQVVLHPTFLYNPGLVTSWFVVTGLLGMLLIMIGSVTASTTMVKEREAGTLEQLLMTPASPSQIIVAKIGPPFVLLCGMTVIALGILRFAWHVPFRGNLLLVISGAVLCLLTGMGIGTFIATFTKSAQQAQLATFFISPPLSSLSGAFTPAEAMPHWLQPFTAVNPIYHFAIILRSTLIKGSGLETVWPHLLALVAFAAVLVSASVWRFRQQLS